MVTKSDEIAQILDVDSVFHQAITVGNTSLNVHINATAIAVGNDSVNVTINSTAFSGTVLNANNAAYLGGTAAADYQTEAGLAANVATMAANSATYVLANSGIVSNSQGVWAKQGNGISVDAGGINVLGNTGTIVNTSGIFVNASYIGTISANNTSYLGGVAASDYVIDTDLDAYQTEAGLAGNVAILAANSANVLIGSITTNSTGIYPSSNTVGDVMGNTISRWVITANSVATSGDVTVGGLVNAVTSVNSTLITVAANVVANTTAVLVGNSTYFVNVTSQAIKIANSTVNTGIKVPTTTEYAGSYYLHANGDWAEVSTGNAVTRVYEAWVANDSVNTTFTVSGGYQTGMIDVYYNGVHLATDEYTANGTTVVLDTAALIGAVIEVAGYQDAQIIQQEFTTAGTNTQVMFNDSGDANGTSAFTFNKATDTVSVANTLVVKIISANGTIGTNGQVLTSNGSVAYWKDAVAPPGGSNTNVLVNDSGVVNGTAGFTFDKASNNVTVANTITVGTSVINSTSVNAAAIYYNGDAVARLATEDQTLAGGARITVKDLGNSGTGTVTPDPGDRPMQKYTNNGAHTLAPGSNYGNYIIDVLNTTGAGAITTSGWTKVTGDTFDTTTTSKFRCHAMVTSDMSVLVIAKVV